MAHELYSSKHILWHGEKPWHGLGVEMSEKMSLGDISANLDLGRVFVTPAYAVIEGDLVATGDNAVMIEIDGAYRGITSGVGDEYRAVQNEQALSLFFDVLGETPGTGAIETVGHLRGGAQFWALAPLEPWQVRGDLHQPYLLLRNPHDSTGELTVFGTAIRVVCNNTLSAALSRRKKADNVLRMRHSGDVDAKIMALRSQARLATAEANSLREVLTAVADIEPTAESVDFALTALLGDPNESGRAKAQRERVTSLWESGIGNAPHAGTVYGLWNAYTELESHWNGAGSKKSEAQARDTRANSLMFGSGRARIQNALSVFADVWAPHLSEDLAPSK